MNPVIHFEMPCTDRDRVAAFYRDAFGWQMQMLGEDMGGYVLAGTTESGPDGRPTAPGAINGGFYPRAPEAAPHPSVVIAVDDIEAAMKAVTKAGGAVIGLPHAIPGIGRYVSFTDTEGNRSSMLQPDMG